MALPPPPWEAQDQDFSPTVESGSPFSPQMPQTGQPYNNSLYPQMPQPGQPFNNNNSSYPQMPQSDSSMYMQQPMPNPPNQALGPSYPQQQQQMMMAQFYAQQQQQQQPQQAYGYGYNQQQQGSSPYLDQQMYGLSIRDQTSHQVPPSSSSSSSSTASYLPPMRPTNKPEDKLFGDLLDLSKFKPTKPTSGRADTM